METKLPRMRLKSGVSSEAAACTPLSADHTARDSHVDVFGHLVQQGYSYVFHLENTVLCCADIPNWSCPIHYATTVETHIDTPNNRMLCAIVHGDVRGILSLPLPTSIDR